MSVGGTYTRALIFSSESQELQQHTMPHKRQSLRAKVGEKGVQLVDRSMIAHATLGKHDEIRKLVESRIRWLMNAGEDHDAFLSSKSCHAGYYLFRRGRIEL